MGSAIPFSLPPRTKTNQGIPARLEKNKEGKSYTVLSIGSDQFTIRHLGIVRDTVFLGLVPLDVGLGLLGRSLDLSIPPTGQLVVITAKPSRSRHTSASPESCAT